MLDQALLEASLPIHGLGKPFHFFPSIGSTNAKALELVAAGAPHGTLVVAEEQTRGRGRAGRRWLTPSGSAIAMSLILRWNPPVSKISGSLSVFGALAVAEAASGVGVDARIKWPNDLLAGGRKIAGVLVESQWQGSNMATSIVGIGINVKPGSVPPPEEVDYPAGCLEEAAGSAIDANKFLLDLILAEAEWVTKLGSLEMLEAWEARLAFKDIQVSVIEEGVRRQGRLVSLDREGNLLLEHGAGQVIVIGPTAADLRPIDTGSV